ncbi:MAG: TonB-dependent receptor, partial [Deltaproteobacteria bacterium]|nr:TonB-dependent receptor [Deltaproteobacteria bacterium]
MRHGKWLSPLVAGMVVLLLNAGSAAAKARAEVEMEKTVITSTLTPKVIEEAPGSIQVITGDDIKKMGAETAADALVDATGIDLDNVAGRGAIPQIRGMSNKRTLILIDGMRFSTGFRDTTVDLNEFPTEVIDHIEIVRGPSSSLYGGEAVGGVINIITKKAPEDFQGSAGVRYGLNTYGEGDNWIGKSSMGGTLGGLGLIVAGHANIRNRFERDVNDDFTDIDDEKKFGGIVKMNYALSDDHEISGGAFITDTNRQGIRPKYGLHWDRDADSERFSSFFSYDGKALDMNLMARAYCSNFDLERSYIDTGEPYPTTQLQNKARQQPDREDFDITNKLYQYEARASRMFGGNHMITLGAEYRDEKREGVENRGESPINKSVDNSAVFFQDDFISLDALQITAGVRLDEHSDFGSEVSPRISLVYDL